MWSRGQRIGEYELLAKLREGGMASLFLARHVGAARHVAIKVIHHDLAQDEQFRQMFLDEALLSSRIQHPNVVHVEELGEHRGAHFLVMEFVHGCSLSELQRALSARWRRLAPAYAVRIAMHVADALHAAHETRDPQGRPLNVVHRDVTPENILLAYGGNVKLVDFGIAKGYGRRHRTQDGLLKGKFRYMAPEQANGKPLDRRVDIYQLGIVLWEMLTLRRLFDAEGDLDLLNAVRQPHVAPPGARVDGIPAALDAALMAALEPQPKRRPPDAQSFARLLERAVPSAREVEAGALRALLLATMHEQRRRDRGAYPPGVYECLDQQEGAQRAGVELAAAQVLESCTVEHTAPRGGGSTTRSESTTHSGGRLRRARVARSLGPPRRGATRTGEFLDFAGELRTALSRVLRPHFASTRLWLALGGVLGLALVLLAIGLMVLHRGARASRPPALPAPLPIAPAAQPGR